METKTSPMKVLFYQSAGFLAIIALFPFSHIYAIEEGLASQHHTPQPLR